MVAIPGFENIEKIKRDYQWYDLNNRKYGPVKHGQKYKGGVPILYDAQSQRIYVDSQDTHTLVYGATGSLKTRSVVMPSIKLLAYANESMIINDAKGELYDRLAGELCEQGFDIVVINLRNPSTGNCWNPLFLPYQFYLQGDIDRACEFINDIANNLTAEDKSTQDPFWDNSAADLTFGLILLLFKYCKEHNESIDAVNISNVLALRRKLFLAEKTKRPKDTDIWKYAEEDELIATSLSGTIFSPNDTMNSILSVFDNKMRIFSLQPTLTDMLANNDFDIADIGRKKTALFMIVPDEKTTYHRLVSLFIKQSYEYLIFTAMHNGGKKVENRVNYCLDEFSSLPSVTDFPAMITAARSRDIRFILVVQSQSSLKRRYQEEADTIMGNCANWIFFTSRELGLLRELSELCGMQKNNHTPNISTYDLQHFDKDRKEALILCGRYKPAKVSMIDIDNPFFSGKSYDILKIPTGKRKSRKALEFSFTEDELKLLRPVSINNPFLNVNDSFQGFSGVIQEKKIDSEYETVLTEIDNIIKETSEEQKSFEKLTSISISDEDKTEIKSQPSSFEQMLEELNSDDWT